MARWAELTLLITVQNGGFCEQGNAENPRLWHTLGRNMWLIKAHYIHECCIIRSLCGFISISQYIDYKTPRTGRCEYAALDV